MRPWLGLALALCSAIALNWAFFVQHGAASDLPSLSIRRPLHSLWMLFSNPRWLLGYLVGIGGWVPYIVALGFAPLSLVQATSAGGIGVLALLVWRVSGVRLSRRERAGVGAALVGLALLGVSLLGYSGAETRGSTVAVALWIASAALAAALAAGPGASLLAPGAGLGVAAGLLYSSGDIATKAAFGGGFRLIFVPVLLACHGTAFVALQLSFQRGGALATAGMSTLFTNSLPIAAGLAVFHDPFPGGVLGWVRGVAFLGVLAGAVLLARKEGPEGGPPDVAPEASAAGRAPVAGRGRGTPGPAP